MKNRISLHSISRSALSLIQNATRNEWRVLACFDRACNIASTQGDVLALVTPVIGNGPLNLVIPNSPSLFSDLRVDLPVAMGDSITVGSSSISYRQAPVWEPQPDWHWLQARTTIIRGNMTRVWANLTQQKGRSDSDLLNLISAWDEHQVTPPPLPNRMTREARPAVELLRIGWQGDFDALADGAMRLAGLGPGLTPAGDDFLMGAMLWAWLAHPVPRLFGYALVEAAVPRTNTLSAAWLRSAAEGECTSAWHLLLLALAGEGAIEAAIDQVLAHGASSGGDMLAGFLWMSSSESP